MGKENLSSIKVQKVMDGMRAVLLHRRAREGGSDEVIFPQRPKGHERVIGGLRDIEEWIVWLSRERVLHKLQEKQAQRHWGKCEES